MMTVHPRHMTSTHDSPTCIHIHGEEGLMASLMISWRLVHHHHSSSDHHSSSERKRSWRLVHHHHSSSDWLYPSTSSTHRLLHPHHASSASKHRPTCPVTRLSWTAQSALSPPPASISVHGSEYTAQCDLAQCDHPRLSKHHRTRLRIHGAV